MRIGLILFYLLIAAACQQQPESDTSNNSQVQVINVKYAKGFTITDHQAFIVITLTQPYPGAKEPLTYRLNRNEANQEGIEIPVDRIVCTSTTHLPALTMLGVAHTLVGFPSIEYISDTIQWRRAQIGELTELGTSNQLDVERLIELEPDAVMAFGMGGEIQQLDKLEELGVDIIYNADYLEESILGRAEWVKVIGALYDRLELADSIFNQIENQYLTLQSKVADTNDRPTVMSGLMYGDAWYMPGGKNWGAKVIEDAGGQYLWDDDSSSGWIEIGFEGVIERAQEADLWIGIAHLESLEQLVQADARYQTFSPFGAGKVYTYGTRKGPGGGISYLELGYARPDIVLADMIKIIHPEALPDYDLYFYGQLK